MRVGVIGGGMMAHAHLGAIRKVKGAEIVGVADVNREALELTALKYKVANRFTSLEELVERTRPEVVHIVTPAATHLPLTLKALELGCHVYVEKPIGLDLAEAEQMVAAAERKKLKLCVGHNFLFDGVMRRARKMIDAGELGALAGIDSYFGMDLGTQPKSRYYSEAYKHWVYSMPGSLMQNVIDHPLALVVPFMGEPTRIETVAVGGCLPKGIASELRMVIGDGQCVASVVASFSASPRFHYVRYHGTHATLLVDLQNKRMLRYGHTEGVPHFVTRALMNVKESALILGNTFATVGKVLAKDFSPFEGVQALAAALYRSIETGTPSPVPGKDALTTMRIMDVAWKQMEEQGFALRPAKERAQAVLAQRKAKPWKRRHKTLSVVTGASGFIGSRLVRALVQSGSTDVRVFVRNEFRAQPLVALGADVVEGDLRDDEAVKRALEGADVVYHLGAAMAGTSADYMQVTVRGTERLVKAALKAGVKKLVHVSTIAVYPVPGRKTVIDESVAYAERELTPYIESKIEAEKVVRQAMEDGLPATILRPGVVYAPGHRLSRIGYPLLGGRFYVKVGLNNVALPAVYVDDLVEAMLLAGTSQAATGRIYNVVSDTRLTQTQYLKLLGRHGKQPVSWIYFPRFVASAMGSTCRALGGLSPIMSKVAGLLAPAFLRSCATEITYSNARIRSELGWEPSRDLSVHFSGAGRYAPGA